VTPELREFIDAEDWVKVGRDEFRKVSSGTAGTDCLGSCLGIAVYDSGAEEGYLFHGSTLGNPDLEEEVTRFLDEVEESLARPYEVLVGGTISSDYNPLDDERVIEGSRQKVEEELEGREISFTAAWNELPVYNSLAVSPEYGILYSADRTST
jgi:hypothetical protein